MKDADRTTQLSNVALLYYGEGLTQSDIAKRLQVSRVTVVNMLRDARDQGIVEIHVGGKQLKENALARDLRDKFGLKDAYISDTFAGTATNRAEALRQIGRVAAMAFLDIVEKGDRIGVAWGETVLALTNALPRVTVEDAEVTQLIGSMISARVPASEQCAIRIASQIGAQCFTLHAPAMVANAELAEVFRTEPTIATQLARMEGLDMVVYSIGNTNDDTHLVAAEMATPEEIHAARNAGATGIIACRFIDADGKECAVSPSDRLISAPLDRLRTASKKLLVVAGLERFAATQSAISGGLVSHLVVDRPLAEKLLSA